MTVCETTFPSTISESSVMRLRSVCSAFASHFSMAGVRFGFAALPVAEDVAAPDVAGAMVVALAGCAAVSLASVQSSVAAPAAVEAPLAATYMPMRGLSGYVDRGSHRVATGTARPHAPPPYR